MPSPASTLLLISRDMSLAQSCQGIVDAFPDVRLLVLARAREADAYLTHTEIKLLLVHIVDDKGASEIVRLLRQLASLERALTLVVISERPSPEQSWSFKRLGAAEYLSRPVALCRLATLVHTIGMCLRPAGNGLERAVPAQRMKVPHPALDTTEHGMAGLLEQVRLVAAQDTTILLTGETGTGKTRLARIIHELSPRRAEPFVAINCGALAGELIESEMFGHVKGAFTGAERTRAGKLAAAESGTVLLDEVDALPVALQAKLLRAVEERVFEPVGSNESVPVRARLIAASNRPLEREVQAGRFRSDLYYRLNVIGFYLPPLHEQPSRIRDLATHFLMDFAARNGRPVHEFSASALRLLENYSWPGNIRELRNVMERAVALCPGWSIEVGDLPDAVRAATAPSVHHAYACEPHEGPATPSALRYARGQAESVLILQALHKHGNNRLRAARELGISRRTLYKKLHRYGLMDMGLARSQRRPSNPTILPGFTHPGKAV
jgi:two-component system response regulator PilR (NtrC family)